ncbi:hypothetical protein GIB67_032234 [Kingdonia uniflora]|uniref:Uncharacterized protein n=1 Tax=Kingdonia uniflora TaxID=39325 RepID=A0A7J7MX60_9MAGN|nr:hypothetical protein GIB67_032234 [Kingdonia uniflora]
MDRRNSAKKMAPVQIDIVRKAKRAVENLGTTNNLNHRARATIGLRRSAQPEIVPEIMQEERNLSPGEEATSEASNQPTHNFKRRRGPKKCKVIATENYLRRPLEYNLVGKPVGEDSVGYSTYLGVIVREDWREHKVQKRKVINIEDDLEQALANFPEDVPYDQWEVFAEQCTTSEYKETRRKHIEVRKNHKLPHACSRLGYPRLEHKMDHINAGEVDLTVLFGPECTRRVKATRFGISPTVYNSVQQSGVVCWQLPEIAPICSNKSRLHKLVACIVSPQQCLLLGFSSQDSLSAEPRSKLLDKVQKFLPPTVMIPERRLEHLVEQALTVQREACVFHNSLDSSISLYLDHRCGKYHIPSKTLQARKPHTIAKQRERWTDDEHNRFHQALKLYGRAWQRIEEHIGTKTTMQIRSHAQKFFSKVNAPRICARLIWSVAEHIDLEGLDLLLADDPEDPLNIIITNTQKVLFNMDSSANTSNRLQDVQTVLCAQCLRLRTPP